MVGNPEEENGAEMSDWGDHLRAGYKHALRSQKLSKEAMKLATDSCLQAMECYKFAASVHDIVMEAARPYLELVQLNADLAQAAANDAERYARRARAAYMESLNAGRELVTAISQN